MPINKMVEQPLQDKRTTDESLSVSDDKQSYLDLERMNHGLYISLKKTALFEPFHGNLSLMSFIFS